MGKKIQFLLVQVEPEAGSLVTYCLDITDLDPIEYNLILKGF